jgi:hypothetical protein
VVSDRPRTTKEHLRSMSAASTPTTRRERFASAPESVRLARRLVTQVLLEADCDDLVDTVALLTSETVTNAVLHAGTEIEVCCEVRRDGVLVSVADESPVVPGLRHYGVEAMTGRGLSMVDLIATSWGVDTEIDGKTVWFEVRAAVAETGPGEPGYDMGVGPDATFVVRLHRLPVELTRATLEYGDALLRELALLTTDDGPGHGWEAPRIDLTPVLRPVEDARRAGLAAIDLEVVLPVAAAHGALERRLLVDTAGELARDGVLYIDPPPTRIRRCGTWLLGEISRQRDGGAPTPWAGEGPGDARCN